MKLVVITGCLGFIGSHLTEECLGMGWKVLGIDNNTYAANGNFLNRLAINSNFSFLKMDICDLKELPDCDYVINTAAETHVGNSIIDSEDFLRSNISGVKNLLDLIKNKPQNVQARPVLFQFSTDEVYGDITNGHHQESEPLNPSNPYSASKAGADMLITAWARTYDINYVIFRPTNNYGIRQYPEKLIPLSVKLLMRGKKIRLHDKGEPTRTWLHVNDTVKAAITIIENGVTNEVFNASGGFEQKNWVTVKKIIDSYYDKEVNWKEYVDLSYSRQGQDVRYSLDDTKLRNLGWSPTESFDREIASIVNYYEKHFIW